MSIARYPGLTMLSERQFSTQSEHPGGILSDQSRRAATVRPTAA